MWLVRALRVSAFGIVVGSAAFVQATEIKTFAQDSFPKYFSVETDGKRSMHGLCIDIMRAVERMEPTVRFVGYDKFIPTKRRWSLLEAGKIDVFVCSSVNKERKKKFQFAQTPLYKIKYVLAVRRADPVHVSSFDDIRKLSTGELQPCGKNKQHVRGAILSLLGTGSSRTIDKQGGLINKPVRSILDALKRLVGCGGQFVYYHDLGLKALIKRHGLKDQVRILPVSFKTNEHKIIFGKMVPKEIVAKVDVALSKLAASGELARLYSKYTR